MKTPGHETQQLEQLLGKYRFTQPVPPGVRADILSSKKKTFVRVLKTAGAYTAIQGAFAALYFTAKKTGIGLFTAKMIVSVMAVLTISVGGYYAVTAIIDRVIRESTTAAPDSSGSGTAWVDEIMLFDGRIIRGAIISRGDSYEVRTERGIILIPRKQIKAVRPLTGESNAPAEIK
jgi:hypothetical protein